MNLLMISGDRSMLSKKQGAFWYTLEALSKEWDRVDVICPKTDSSFQLSASRNAVFFGNVFFHSSPRGLWHQPRWIVQKGKELIAKHNHAVMTVHEYPPFYNGIGARKLSKETGVPHVLEVHHIVGYPVAASFAETVGRWMSRFYLPSAIRRSAGCRTVSKGTAETLMRWRAPESKIRVVPSFYLDAGLIASLGHAPAVLYDVVFCGRLVPNKGIRQILEAVADLPRATLLIIGDGPERMWLEERARDLGIKNRVEFRGWLPTQKDVLQAIRSARMLIMNSTSEGGPRVVLEAMAVGVPVIVTRVGVMPDVIVDRVNGVFTNGTAADVKKQIELLLTDDQLRLRIGKEGGKILERFERTKLIANYAHFLRSFARS